MTNLILNTDSYKASHFVQYPSNVKYVSSYIEARSNKNYNFTLFFGLQMFIKEVLLRPIKTKHIDEAEAVFKAHGEPFNRAGWDYIVKRHNGYLPLKIQAVKEGTVMPTGNVLVQVTNTDPNVPWLVSYVETMLLRAVWYPTTVATRSKFIKHIIGVYVDDTSDNPDHSFKLHDFGARGASSNETAGIGGLAHLVNFMGTDTVQALVYGRKFYSEFMAGYSIPAAEHSTITAWGKDREADAYANMLDKFPTGLVAVVSDSYDLWNAIDNIWGGALKDRVLARDGTLVVRPDSGDPTTVPVETVARLMYWFGHTTNSKGYKVLPPQVRVIQGDGINEETIAVILANMKAAGLSIDNIAFGMGGEMLQTMNRDTLGFAMKASAVKTDSYAWEPISKNPATDPNKVSKRGRLGLIKEDGTYKTVSETEANGKNLLETVYENGKILRSQTLAEIRTLSEG